MIIFSTVTKQFSPDSYAVKDVSFEVEPGEMVFITGNSGSGKTSLMRLLTKEYTPTSGEIKFEDTYLSQVHFSRVHDLRRKIGVVFQDYRLLPELNVWENIALPLSIIGKDQHEIEERVTDLLRLVSMVEKAHLFPGQLSGGEAQRISIARALATGPSVVFADEPTGNLDRDTARSIAQLLHQINELGTTMFFATHSHDIIDLYPDHRRLHLEKGELKSDTKQKKAAKKSAAEDPPPPKASNQAEGGFFSRLFGRKPVADTPADTSDDSPEPDAKATQAKANSSKSSSKSNKKNDDAKVITVETLD
jgi:cell division transport system ATP-binding protein